MLVQLKEIETPDKEYFERLQQAREKYPDRIFEDFIPSTIFEKGVYELQHFLTNVIIKDLQSSLKIKETDIYGVCDSYEDILNKYPILKEDSRKFFIILNEVKKSEQPEKNGWRWHKWGKYIGNQKPICEYLVEEPIIESVYIFCVYKYNF